MKELGYYIPKTNENSYPIAKDQPVIQINDVDIDSRVWPTRRIASALDCLSWSTTAESCEFTCIGWRPRALRPGTRPSLILFRSRVD